MPSLLLALLAAAGAAVTPSPNVVSTLTIPAIPKDAPPVEASITVGSGDLVGGQDVAIWPVGAREAGVGGQVVLTCRIDVHGLAETCRVAYERPYRKGFGAAALALRPLLKLTPRRGPDGPIEASINIAVEFKPSQVESNLTALEAANIPPDGGDRMANLGNHEVSARNLTVLSNPMAMRRVTLTDGPIWTQAPGFEAFAAAYPADGGGIEGYAVAHCKLEATGVLAHCVTAREIPVGHGFGKAAVALAAQFRISPKTIAGAPKGAPLEVDVPVRFPAAAEAKDRVVRSPIWLAGADPQTLIRQFPQNVPVKKASPGAVVRCQVGADGGLTACETELTSPDGIDFDEAAVRLASHLRMNLWSADARPVQGGIVHLPVRLTPDEQAKN